MSPDTSNTGHRPDPGGKPGNLARLPLALKDLGARIRTAAVPEGPPFSHDATSLAAADVWNPTCADGEFDIWFRSSGFDGGHAQLAVDAHRLRVGETEVVFADLADVIRSKESAGRPNDLRGLAAEFCAAIADDELRVIEITPHDYRRMAELLTTYSSLRLQVVLA